MPTSLVLYRIHASQVSQSALETRKRFEGQLMLLDFLARNSNLIRSMAMADPKLTQKLVRKLSPIYGDKSFGWLIKLTLIPITGVQFDYSPHELFFMANSLGSLRGIAMPISEFPTYRPLTPRVLEPSVNFSFDLALNTCSDLVRRLQPWNYKEGSSRVLVGCQHSISDSEGNAATLPCGNNLSEITNQKLLTLFLHEVRRRSLLSANPGQELSMIEAKLIQALRNLVRFLRKMRSKFFFIR